MVVRNNYNEDVEDANELIDEFGQDGFLRRDNISGPKYKPVKGAPTDYPIIFVVDPDGFKLYEVDGERVLATDKKIYLAKKGLATVEPKTSDKLVIGGVAHSIVNIKPVSPAGVVVYWLLQVRQ